MDAEKRRRHIIDILIHENAPVPGGELARRAGVSRQVIVQDIALLRAGNKSVMSTNKGYILHKPSDSQQAPCIRVFCTSHKTEETLEELYTIVDFGGRLLNVSVDHDLYGQICVDLIINNRLDAMEFVHKMMRSEDLPLKMLTGGCHYHTVAADSEKNLDRIEAELKEKGYLK